MEESFLIVEKEDAGKRLDVWLSGLYRDFSRTYFQELLDEGLVLVNGQLQPKRYRVQAGDEVELELRMRELPQLVAEELPLEIVYEDEHILVINKAYGMVVHPAPGNPTGTIANALAYRYGLGSASREADQAIDLRPGIVHRLDKDTSGLLITAKSQLAHTRLVEQFASRKTSKTYLAIACKNKPPEKVELAIERDPNHRQRMIASGHGKSAITLFKPLASSEGAWALHALEVGLLTGRTHQIRVHLKAHQAPLLGDTTYGWSAWQEHYQVPRQMLHAWKLALEHPILGTPMEWVAPIPSDIALILDSIQSGLCHRLSNLSPSTY